MGIFTSRGSALAIDFSALAGQEIIRLIPNEAHTKRVLEAREALGDAAIQRIKRRARGPIVSWRSADGLFARVQKARG